MKARQPRWRILLAEDAGVYWVNLFGHWHPSQPDALHKLPFFLLTKRVRSAGANRTVRELRVVLDAIEQHDPDITVAAQNDDPIKFADKMKPLLQDYAQYAASHPATNDARLRGKVATRWLAARTAAVQP